MFESLKVLDNESLNFNEGSLLIMNLTLALIMFGVALEINLDNFKKIVKNPKSAIIGVISQFILLPAFTFVLVYILRPPPSVALGMILVAACPGGNISNFITVLAKGNAALSVSLTAFATITAIFLTPLNFKIWGSFYQSAANIIKPITIDPLQMLFTVSLILGLPLTLGIFFANKFPNITKKIINPIKIISILIFFGYVAAALASNFDLFLKYVHIIAIIVLIHNALGLVTGFSFSSVFRLPHFDRRSVTIETGIQNSGLALVLIFNPKLFDGLGGMAMIAAWWGIWHILSGLFLGFLWSRIPLKKASTENE